MVINQNTLFSFAWTKRKEPKEKSSQNNAACAQASARPLFWLAGALDELFSIRKMPLSLIYSAFRNNYFLKTSPPTCTVLRRRQWFQSY